MLNAVQARQAISNLLLAGMLFLGPAGLAAAGDPKEIKNSIDMELILIPSGSFQMGADKNFEPDARGDESPRHSVTISTPFYMGKYEVTQEQWAAIMGDNPSEFKGRTRPVTNVSDIYKFIEVLNEKEGKKYRLPTEAEWEYAARAGTKTAYYFGDDQGSLSQYGWYDGNSSKQTHPVGMLQPNAWGLYDMLGNVCEYCSDWYQDGYYNESPKNDPSGPLKGSGSSPYTVSRGGSYAAEADKLRVASRGNYTACYANGAGFRLALSAPEIAGNQAEKEQLAAGIVKKATQAGGVNVGQIAEEREKQRLAVEKAAEQANRAADAERAAGQQSANNARASCRSQCEALKYSCSSQCNGLSDKAPNWAASSPRTNCAVDCNIAEEKCKNSCQ